MTASLKNDLDIIREKILEAVNPEPTVRKIADRDLRAEFDRFDRLFLIGGGKAALSMAAGLTDIADSFEKGVVLFPDNSVRPRSSGNIDYRAASHPVPSAKNTDGAKAMLSMAEEAGKNDLILFLLSGGFSSMSEYPEEGLELDDLTTVSAALMNAGADISELNTLRRHLSRVKGGKPARAAYPARIIGLIVSDVPGNVLHDIGSGPTCPDPTSLRDCLDILDKMDVGSEIPKRVFDFLSDNNNETPKEGENFFRNIDNRIILSNEDAVGAGLREAGRQGFESVEYSRVTGEAYRAGAEMVKCFRERYSGGPMCLIGGGETTVNVKGKGRGGRNQEFALGAAVEAAGMKNICGFAMGTDGIDGPTDAAGAWFDGTTTERAFELGMNAGDYLDRNDSYRFFENIGGLLITGPTGTNVMDIAVIAVRDGL